MSPPDTDVLRLRSWNVAFGSPSLPRGQVRRELVRHYLHGAGDDVVVVQEGTPGLLENEWQVVEAPVGGRLPACVMLAVRRGFGELHAVELQGSAAREHCVVAADLTYGNKSLRLVSLYVPWEDSSAQWLDTVLGQAALQVPGVVGADLNSPVGRTPPPHPMFDIAKTRGLEWSTTPLLSQGPTMKQSQIDHVLCRDVTVPEWSVDQSVLDARLSDHAALRLTVLPADVS